MQGLYKLWLLLVLALIVNMVACIFLLLEGASDGGKDMISGVVYLPVITVASFLLWYRPIYNGLMKEHSIFFYVYFIFAGFHLAFSVYVFLGVPSTGSAGLINTIQAFADSELVAGILGAIATALFGFQGLGNLWYYRLIWKHKQREGPRFARPRTSWLRTAMRATLRAARMSDCTPALDIGCSSYVDSTFSSCCLRHCTKLGVHWRSTHGAIQQQGTLVSMIAMLQSRTHVQSIHSTVWLKISAGPW